MGENQNKGSWKKGEKKWKWKAEDELVKVYS